MEYLLKAAQQFIENMVKESFDAMSIDIEMTETEYADYYAGMGRYLLKVRSYTKLSDLMRDIEDGEWGVALLDSADDQGMVEFFKIVAQEASDLLPG